MRILMRLEYPKMFKMVVNGFDQMRKFSACKFSVLRIFFIVTCLSVALISCEDPEKENLRRERDELIDERDNIEREKEDLEEENEKLKRDKDELEDERDQLEQERDELEQERDELEQEQYYEE